MRIAFGTDMVNGFTEAVVDHLRQSGHDVAVVAGPEVWPEAGRRVGEEVASGRATLGVVCCWTGTGVSIAANKVRGARAALCADAPTADGARRWNDANVVALSIRSTSEAVAAEIVDAFVAGTPDPGETVLVAALE